MLKNFINNNTISLKKSFGTIIKTYLYRILYLIIFIFIWIPLLLDLLLIYKLLIIITYILILFLIVIERQIKAKNMENIRNRLTIVTANTADRYDHFYNYLEFHIRILYRLYTIKSDKLLHRTKNSHKYKQLKYMDNIHHDFLLKKTEIEIEKLYSKSKKELVKFLCENIKNHNIPLDVSNRYVFIKSLYQPIMEGIIQYFKVFSWYTDNSKIKEEKIKFFKLIEEIYIYALETKSK